MRVVWLDAQREWRARKRLPPLLAQPHMQPVPPRLSYRVMHRVGAHETTLGVERARVDAAKGEGYAMRVGGEFVDVAGPRGMVAFALP